MSKRVAVVKVRTLPPHFDAPLTVAAAQKLIADPKRVAAHAFHPFIEYEKRWIKFPKPEAEVKEKSRLIRYACRRDACIFSWYRAILSDCYESKLKDSGISESVIGYRRIACVSGEGKCNIHFAQEAFSYIRESGNCYVYTLDISQFFENLDHKLLKNKWCEMIGVSRLPADHHKIFKAVTRYACVNKRKAYEALGFIGESNKPGSKSKKYLIKREDIPLQLCNPKQFRDKIVPLIERNDKTHGIPQGAAISDVLSNIYLFDFDKALHAWIGILGGRYFRYSDDILIVLPKTEDHWNDLLDKVSSQIKASGNHLEIHKDKCAAYQVSKVHSEKQTCTLVHQTGCPNGIEYLGFRYDGQNIFLRESTRARLNRTIVRSCRRVARSHVHHNPTFTLKQLKSSINKNRVYLRIGRVKDFDETAFLYKKWTFWTYVKRCDAILGSNRNKILAQLSRYRAFVARTLEAELEAAFKRSNKP